MQNSEAIATALPYLRRYARAVTGSQAAGDGFVISTLEAIVANPRLIDATLGARISLYRSFSQILITLELSEQKHAPAVNDNVVPAAERNLAAITPLPRQAFLLMAVEQFSPAETAAILDADEEDVRLLIDRASREIAKQVATSAVIIEDEPLIAMDLEHLIEQLGHRVCAIARTHDEAVAAVSKHKPGFVVADIHLADGSSGLEAVKEIISRKEVPVIFVTAYPEQLLTGDRTEPTFLVTKPFRSETLKAVISQALFFSPSPSDE